MKKSTSTESVPARGPGRDTWQANNAGIPMPCAGGGGVSQNASCAALGTNGRPPEFPEISPAFYAGKLVK